jgi:hypothetical protein
LKQNNRKSVFCVQSEKIEVKKIKAKQCEMKGKKLFLISQKTAKMKLNKMRFASFCFEAKIKKERKRDTLLLIFNVLAKCSSGMFCDLGRFVTWVI